MRKTRLTSDEYRTFGIPFRFENPDEWQGYSKFSPHPFYRTSNQEYGRYKPMIHTMPTVFRPQCHAFTDILRIGRDHHHRTFNTSTTNLPPIWSSSGTLPMSIGRENYFRRPQHRSNK
ncbi:unnamed protein product [Rotaria sordida]|uniref:Uncharacterized protein n=1 Tax=Rotaria sordida TaxID=392033 RepID=A0A814TFR7_9BILA|nr:unnamed protein product [Rotaria sordida]